MSSTTVGRPWVSAAVETTPFGLFSMWTSRRSGATGSPSTMTWLDSSTSRAGSVTIASPTVTRPERISSSEARRDATPEWARNFARRMPSRSSPARAPAGGSALLAFRLGAPLARGRWRAAASARAGRRGLRRTARAQPLAALLGAAAAHLAALVGDEHADADDHQDRHEREEQERRAPVAVVALALGSRHGRLGGRRLPRKVLDRVRERRTRSGLRRAGGGRGRGGRCGRPRRGRPGGAGPTGPRGSEGA